MQQPNALPTARQMLREEEAQVRLQKNPLSKLPSFQVSLVLSCGLVLWSCKDKYCTLQPSLCISCLFSFQTAVLEIAKVLILHGKFIIALLWPSIKIVMPGISAELQ